MAISESAIVRALTTYCFETIWNEPDDESSVCLQLYPVGQRFLTNTIVTFAGSLELPTKGSTYAVFWTNYELFDDALVIPPNQWIQTNHLGNAHRTLFHVYSETGLILPKSSVYIYHAKYSRKVYIAVLSAPLVRIVGLLNYKQLYLSVYRYASFNATVLDIKSFHVPTFDPTLSNTVQIQSAITLAKLQYPLGAYIYLNGYDITALAAPQFSGGDYIDIYTDATIIAVYSLNVQRETINYFSPMYQTYKTILHCPKALNPDNLITTRELLTLTARRNTDQLGCLIHRNEKNGVTQITHNDVGVNTDILNAYQLSLGTPDISVEVRLRSHNNRLIREINGLQYLYLCDDEKIVQFLSGKGDPTLPFWTAAELERSDYVGYMSSYYNYTKTATLAGFMTSIGYYAALSALCQHNKNYVIDQLPVNGIAIRKPLILSDVTCYPLVYLNGTKLRDTQVDYTNTRHRDVSLSITPEVYVQMGQILSVELIESGVIIPYLFTPTPQNTILTVPCGSVNVYEVNQLSNNVVGYKTTANVSYTPITPAWSGAVVISATSSNSTTLTFGEESYGNSYVVCNAIFSKCYTADLTDLVANAEPLFITLNLLCNDGTTYIPLIGHNSLYVYLNGRRLIEGIDYLANPLCDPAGNTAILQVMLSNRDVVSFEQNNYLEVIAHSGQVIEDNVGFVINDKINVDNRISFWYYGLSSLYADGYYQPTPTDMTDLLIPKFNVDNAKPFLISTNVPSYTADLFAGYSSTQDDQNIALINTYLNEQPSINPSDVQIIINRSWQVYSPYYTAIVYDTITQSITYNNDADDTLFLQQFSSYDYLKINDPTLGGPNSHIDLRYCDLYPVYKQVIVANINTYNVMHRLAQLVLSVDHDTLGDVLNA